MTQTPNPDCPDCGGTGFIPPFMDECACPKVTLIVKPASEFLDADLAAALDAVADLAPHKLAAEAAETHTSGDADFDELMDAANAWDAAQNDTVDAVPAWDTDLIAGVAEAAADAWVAAQSEIADALAANAAMVAAAEAGEPPFAPPMSKLVELVPAGGKFATTAQVNLLTKLVAERDVANPVVGKVAADIKGVLTSRDASKLIDVLLSVPADPAKKPGRTNNYDGICRHCQGEVPAKTGTIEKVDGRWVTYHLPGGCLSAEAKAEMFAERVTEPGLYKWDLSGPTVVYRVRKSRSSDRLYAEKVIVHDHDGEKTVEFAYNGKAMAFLRKSKKLTWLEARDFGAAYGSCVACGRTLSDPRALVQGYGATCAGHYGWPTVTKKQAEAIIEGVLTWDDVIAGLGVLTS